MPKLFIHTMVCLSLLFLFILINMLMIEYKLDFSLFGWGYKTYIKIIMSQIPIRMGNSK